MVSLPGLGDQSASRSRLVSRLLLPVKVTGFTDLSAGKDFSDKLTELVVKVSGGYSRAIDRLILGILGKGSVELVVRSHLGIPHGAAVWRRLLREVCLPFLRPYPILAAVMDGDIPSRPSSL